MKDKGTLYLVATPIGNLEDITLRALRILREADIVAAEDTRQTLKLLNHYEIRKPLVSYHEHNKGEKGKYLLQRLEAGENVALVSDAGTPGISDPGEDMVRLAAESGIAVTIAPGPAAAVAGVVLSGLPARRFVFEGFLPVNKGVRRKRLAELPDESRTLVFYEAPHKLTNTLKDLRDALGNRRIAIARELTKKFEEIIRCTLDEAIALYENKMPKGEYVLILEGAAGDKSSGSADCEWAGLSAEEHVDRYIHMGFERKEAMKMAARDRGVNKRDMYSRLISEKADAEGKDVKKES